MLTEKEFRDEYIKHVRNIMDAFGIKQVELARASEMSEVTISRYLNGLRKPTAYNAYRISIGLERLKELRERQRNATDDEWDMLFFGEDIGEDKGKDDDEWGLFW